MGLQAGDLPDLEGADLSAAFLSGANLRATNLTDADLTDAVLTYAQTVETVVDGARLAGASAYGVAAWGLDLCRVRDQTNLHITPEGRAGLTVDNLELAQFVYLMVHNEKIRGIIDTIGRKAVLILGRFYGERKALLDALKVRLREFDLVPIVFDRDKPTSRDLTETVALLASMSRFVVGDVTDAKSIPQELSEIVPRLPSVPVQPILLRGDPGYAMFEHWTSYRTMLPVYRVRGSALCGAPHKADLPTFDPPTSCRRAKARPAKAKHMVWDQFLPSCTKRPRSSATPHHGFNRYPVRSIHVATTTNTARNNIDIPRLMPTATSAWP
ncbi:MAG: pentapeptide repeat-containing protein [Proteobacteria bacterium]|nr:pentapeptide repeat-containing protein [Pseudomonadota bacterium]